MGSKTEADKMDGKSFPILEDLAEDEDLNIKVTNASKAGRKNRFGRKRASNMEGKPSELCTSQRGLLQILFRVVVSLSKTSHRG